MARIRSIPDQKANRFSQGPKLASKGPLTLEIRIIAAIGHFWDLKPVGFVNFP